MSSSPTRDAENVSPDIPTWRNVDLYFAPVAVVPNDITTVKNIGLHTGSLL